ncbi:MAG: AmmeMemoRadiSam system radical SAM enzyme [Firmicutes bacterium]|nr:AmmeMemoRadiSam system radical SAM enzyme [Bacillota bacterium]
MELSGRMASYYQRENGGVRCSLCPHQCLVLPGKAGICRTRINQGGELIAAGYGAVSSIALDPMEKKPLFHFYPGSTILSLGSFGCNLRCQFCQNWQISQRTGDARHITPEAVVELAQEYLHRGCVGVAFTYNEPLMWYEFILDTAKQVQAAKLKTVLVTNGYISMEPWQRLLAHIDAVNIDIKGWDDEFYRKLCGGRLQPVLDNAQVAGDMCHIEVTYLLIPGHNDDDESLAGFSRWIRDNLGGETPVHFSRYYPNYRLDIAPTPVSTLKRAREIASKWLTSVYLGNVTDGELL